MKKTNETKKGAARMDYTVKAALGTFCIVAGAIALIMATSLFFPFWRGPISDLIMFSATNAISLFILIFSVFLTFVYLRDYLELKSGFTFGLLMAVVSFMLFAITSMPLLQWFLGIYGRPGMFSIIPYVFAAISLAILAWLSSK